MSRTPFVRQIAWLSLLPQLLVMFGLMVLGYWIDLKWGFFYGAGVYLLLSFGLKFTISWHHRNGIQHVKAGKHLLAIEAFEKSYAFFSKHPWIDKFRYITLLSGSKMSYREMALCNIAFCNSQIGQGQKAIEYYQKALTEFPESGLAQTGLNMLQSMQNPGGESPNPLEDQPKTS